MMGWADQNVILLFFLGMLFVAAGSALLVTLRRGNKAWFMALNLLGAAIIAFGIAGVTDAARVELVDQGDTITAGMLYALPPLLFVVLATGAFIFAYYDPEGDREGRDRT